MLQGIARPVEGHVLGQAHRQIGLGHGHDAAGPAMDDRDRAAPVALARHQPVAQAVMHRALAGAQIFQALDRALDRRGHVEAVEEIGMGDPAIIDIGRVADGEGRRIGARRDDHRLHRQAVFAGEIEIALVMRRAAEDGAGAVFHQHEIGDIDRQLPARIEGMDRLQAGVVALLLHGLQGFGRRRRLAAFLDERRSPGSVWPASSPARGWSGGDRHEGGAEQGVGPGGEDLLSAPSTDFEPASLKKARAPFGAADPVLLHQPHLGRPALQAVEGAAQLLGIVGDAEEPLRELAPLDHRAGAPAPAVDHLLVGQHGLIDRVPVDARPPCDRPGPPPACRGTSPARGGSIRDGRWRSRGSSRGTGPWTSAGRAWWRCCRRSIAGWTFFSMAAFSAGRPKASQPMGCSTLKPRARLKRAITSPSV